MLEILWRALLAKAQHHDSISETRPLFDAHWWFRNRQLKMKVQEVGSFPFSESPRHKCITRRLFATAMLALTLNNGIDVWQKLRPQPVQTAAVQVVDLKPEEALQALVKPVVPAIPAIEVK